MFKLTVRKLSKTYPMKIKKLFFVIQIYMKDSEIGPVPQTCPIILTFMM
jgi:hypothetical protein